MGKHDFNFQPIESMQITVIDGDRGKHYPKEHEFHEDGFCLFLTAKNVTAAGFQFGEKLFIDEHKDALLRKGRLKRGDIVITTRGTVGNIAYFDQRVPFDNIRINSGMAIIRNESPNCDTRFLYTVLKSAIINNQVERLTFGSAQPQLTIGIINSLKLPFPPLPEQKKIADILSTWDDAIATVSRLIESKRALKKGLMQQLLTSKRRFPGFTEPWQYFNLRDISTIRRGASPRPIADPKWFSESGRGWVRIADVTASDVYLRATTQYLSLEGESKSVPVDPGDLIMSICATIGVPRIVDIPACIHDGFVVIRDYENTVDKYFLYYFITYITDRLANSGQPGTQKNLNTTIVGNIEIPVFDLTEQRNIAKILQALDHEITEIVDFADILGIQKRGLMQKLLTGQVRVKVDEEVSG